jgi:uncharacterized DUF497 family protein
VHIEFDAAKNEGNVATRGLSFEMAAQFDFATALIDQDIRKAYPEPRYVALGFLGKRLHVLCFTPVLDGIRVINFRKANVREVRTYAEQTRSVD